MTAVTSTDTHSSSTPTDEKYLTMVLLIRSRSGQSPRDSYAIASSRLISKLDSIEVRAVCRFGLTGDWEEVLNEAGGSVLDTLGLALKWAPDGIVRTASFCYHPGCADA